MVLNRVTAIILFASLIFNMLLYRGCKDAKEETKQVNKEIKALIYINDSILKLPPDTVKLPVVISKDSLIYVDRWHKPIPPTAQTYTDSLINDSIDVRVTIKADNVYSLNYAYKPIYKYQEVIIEKKVPFDVIRTKETKVPQNGFYLNAGLGYGIDPAIQLQLLYLNKNNRSMGLSVTRYGTENIYMVNYGIKL